MPQRPVTWALVGNPNTGKSTLFNRLTGLDQRTGNYPGVTVERKVGTLKLGHGQTVRLVDLPGAFGLYPATLDERVTADILRTPTDPDHPSGVVVVADSSHLKPSLLLLTQVLDLGLPAILALNMTDRLTTEGLTVDAPALSRVFGVPVVALSARTGAGVPDLLAHMARPRVAARPFFRIPEGFRTTVEQVQAHLALPTPYGAYQQLLSSPLATPELTDARAALRLSDPQALIANEITVRYDRIQELLLQAEATPVSPTERLTERLDRWVLHPVWGMVLLVALLVVLFQAIFTWAAAPMDAIDQGMAWVGDWLSAHLAPSLVSRLLVEGVWAGLQGVVVFVPQIALLFLGLAFLEGTGYLARVGFLTDRLMRPVGLSGRAIIPLLGGFACAVPSIMAVRSLPTAKERILTALTIPLMSCSARIPVYTVLIALLVPAGTLWGVFEVRGLLMTAFYLGGAVVAFGVAYVLSRVIKDPDGSRVNQYLTQLPSYKLPRLRDVLLDVYRKVYAFVEGAGKVIVLLSVVLWVLAAFGPAPARERAWAQYQAQVAEAPDEATLNQAQLDYQAAKLETSFAGVLGRTVEPILAPLGMDWKMGIAVITSFAAREVFVGTMNTLYSVGESADADAGYRTLTQRLAQEQNPTTGGPAFTAPVVLSLLVFYALALQCMSTLAVARRELGGWRWALVLLVYQSLLAYLASLLTYQLLVNSGL
ncbi:MAG: ferrous iron transport protein B [Bacteroidia bacterium]|nr:ferrous iron transport protein B [Bacteroidia bacterium]